MRFTARPLLGGRHFLSVSEGFPLTIAPVRQQDVKTNCLPSPFSSGLGKVGGAHVLFDFLDLRRTSCLSLEVLISPVFKMAGRSLYIPLMSLSYRSLRKGFVCSLFLRLWELAFRHSLSAVCPVSFDVAQDN